MAFPNQEKVPLKKPSLGPPDVYPQHPKQREDELTQHNVKQGFAYHSACPDEYGSASKDINITPAQLGTYFSGVFSKKEEINTLPDNGKKKPPINKDNFWLVTQKSKNHVDLWFKDLAGSKPLHVLAKKKVPAYHKKEDVFVILCEHDVPVSRATWFIKMTAAYQVTMSEARLKRRLAVDPACDWTQAITKYMREQLQKLLDHQLGTGAAAVAAAGFLTATAATAGVSVSDAEAAQRSWAYCARLARFMYCEGLLERQEFLCWVLELLEQIRAPPPSMQQLQQQQANGTSGAAGGDDSTVVKMLLAFAYQYVTDLAQQYLLARRLAHVCCEKLAQMINSASTYHCAASVTSTPTSMNPTSAASSGAPGSGSLTAPPTPSSSSPPHQAAAVDTLQEIFGDYAQCAQHRAILLLLSGALVTVTIACPSALVWLDLAEGKSTIIHSGSPLDALPCSPSMLPLPSLENVVTLRAGLREIEKGIARRGQAAEMRWSSEKVQQSMTGCVTAKLLRVLEVLDKFNFEHAETTVPIDGLYTEVFSAWNSRTAASNSGGTEVTSSPDEEPLVFLLCEWATTACRHGDHRAIIVAKLLEKRQSDVTVRGSTDDMDEGDESAGSRLTSSAGHNGDEGSDVYAYHSMLLRFLDTRAPVLDETCDADTRMSFNNLISLYGELVRADIFSHDSYVCTLISRGDLLACPIAPGVSVRNETLKFDERDMETEDLVWNQDDLQKTSPEAPSSVRSVRSEFGPNTPASVEPFVALASGVGGGPSSIATSLRPPPLPSRHVQYLEHFPLPPADDSFSHESSQRMVALYGVGKTRDDARHAVRKAVRELSRLFSKRFSVDVCTPDLSSRVRVRKELDMAQARFRRLTRHDQHAVSKSVLDAMLEAYSAFVARSATFIPAIEHVIFFFDLMESSHNIASMIDYLVQVVGKVWEVNTRIAEIEAGTKVPVYVGKYAEQICLYAVAMTRCHFATLLLEPERCGSLFDDLVQAVKQVKKADECSSSERCILVFLYELYDASNYLRENNKYHFFLSCMKNIQDTLLAAVTPATSPPGVLNPDFQPNVFENVNLWKFRPDTIFTRQLNENKYSFVCNAIFYVCGQTNTDKVNEAGVLCAEFTACSQVCCFLHAEWLAVFRALCCSDSRAGYPDVFRQIEVASLAPAAYESLAVFVAILVARKIFSIVDFVKHVAVPSLMRARPQVVAGPESEAGARLTCHILLRLFKHSPFLDLDGAGLSGSLVAGSVKRSMNLRSSCDLHLLIASHAGVQIGPLVDVLRATILLGEATAMEAKKKKQQSGTVDIISSLFNSLSEDEDDGEMNGMLGVAGGSSGPMSAGSGRTDKSATIVGLDCLAKRTLAEICREDWVRERFLKEPERLLEKEQLLDRALDPHMAWHLVELVCRKPSEVPAEPEDTDDSNWQQAIITRILQTLDKWSFRVAWLELQLMYTRQPSAGIHNEMSILLDNIARATLDVFQSQTEGGGAVESDTADSKEGLWLVAPLIAKLETSVQGRVLGSAALVLENSNKLWWPIGNNGGSKSDKDKERSMSLLNHLPFLSLVLTCLKGNDELREGTLTSLQAQLEKFVTCAKEDKLPTDDKQRRVMYEALQLRLSLVGGMFDTLQRTNNLTTEWALLFLDLIAYSVVDPVTTSDLYYTVLDMLATLVHGTLVSDGTSDRSEDNRKFYQTLIKKMKRELGERQSSSAGVSQVRQLLPLSKVNHEVIVCEPHGSLVDTKGNKIQGFESINKKHGLQVADKVKIKPWDLWEGFKNPAPLSWTYFGAVRMERKPLKYEEQFRLMLQHNHPSPKDDSYYLAPPPQPPMLEDIEPPSAEKQEEKPELIEVKEEAKKARPSKPAKKRAVVRQAAVAPYAANSPAAARRAYAASSTEPLPTVPPNMAAGGGPWYAPPPGAQPTSQSPYYGQGINSGGVPMHPSVHKKALMDVLRAKYPGGGLPAALPGGGVPVAGAPPPNYGAAGSSLESQKKNLLRQHLLHRKAHSIEENEYRVLHQQMSGGQQPQIYGTYPMGNGGGVAPMDRGGLGQGYGGSAAAYQQQMNMVARTAPGGGQVGGVGYGSSQQQLLHSVQFGGGSGVGVPAGVAQQLSMQQSLGGYVAGGPVGHPPLSATPPSQAGYAAMSAVGSAPPMHVGLQTPPRMQPQQYADQRAVAMMQQQQQPVQQYGMQLQRQMSGGQQQQQQQAQQHLQYGHQPY